MRDIVDLVHYTIRDAHNYIQEIATNNVVSYFDTLAQYYMIIYGVYMGLSISMCFIFGFLFINKLKQELITSANILAIMPLEEIETRDRAKIEAFLNS